MIGAAGRPLRGRRHNGQRPIRAPGARRACYDGETPFQQLAKGAGLTSPFAPGCLEQVVDKAKNWLG